jgi:hypothetical protein
MFSGNLQTLEGLEALNTHLSDRSYVNGFRPSQNDTYFFETLDHCPSDNFPHVCRWYRHMSSFGIERRNFPSQINTTEGINRNVNKSLVSHVENNRIHPPEVRN